MFTGMTMKLCHVQLPWGSRQTEVLDRVRSSYVHTDDETQRGSVRCLHVEGKAGSGRSSVLFECAVRACKDVNVLFVCPNGAAMHSIKSKLSDMEGVERIRVNTLHGALNHQSPHRHDKIKRGSTSVLRQCELIVMDEGAQYADYDWDCFHSVIQAQLHQPFLVIGSDFQQNNSREAALTAESRIRKFCKDIPSVVLDSVSYGLRVWCKSWSGEQ